jgi:hypothetical protein
MCCEDELTVSEDIRVIYDELEKANTWIFAAQEILRPEKEEFDPDLNDIGNIETVLSFAIYKLKEAVSLCQIYRGSKEEPEKETPKKMDYMTLGKYLEPKISPIKQKIIEKLGELNCPPPTRATLDEVKLRETQKAVTELERKLEALKANMSVQREKLTPGDLKLYKDK